MADRTVDSIFCEAIEIKSSQEREAFLDEACGADRERRDQLGKLIGAHLQAGGFMRIDDEGEHTMDHGFQVNRNENGRAKA